MLLDWRTQVRMYTIQNSWLSIIFYNFDDPLRPGSLAYYGYTLANHLVKKKVLTPEIAPDIP